jgi:hypothetical protein
MQDSTKFVFGITMYLELPITGKAIYLYI